MIDIIIKCAVYYNVITVLWSYGATIESATTPLDPTPSLSPQLPGPSTQLQDPLDFSDDEGTH